MMISFLKLKDKMSKKIRIFEVGARDGLQNEFNILDVNIRTEFVRRLAKTGVKDIEVGSIVSSKWVPQMQDSDKVFKRIIKSNPDKINYSLLVPNLKGFDIAVQNGAKEVAIFTAASEKFSQKNTNCSIEESFTRFAPVMEKAKTQKIKVRGYLSTVFECPFQGPIAPSLVAKIAKRLLDMGSYEVSLGDTIGVGAPNDVEKLLKQLQINNIPLSKVAMHFHNTRGTALANVVTSLELGIRNFDSSIGGLGGCPYAPGAMGNLATEDLVYLTERMGYNTGMDLKKLIQTHHWIQSKVGHPLSSHLGRSGLG